jgi:hypothetical protein
VASILVGLLQLAIFERPIQQSESTFSIQTPDTGSLITIFARMRIKVRDRAIKRWLPLRANRYNQDHQITYP